MGNQIFREKSMEQLNAPEQLTGYLRVTGPGVWVVLAGVIVLLAGLLSWGIFGSIISTVTAPAVVRDGEIFCYVLEENMEHAGQEVDVEIGDIHMEADVTEAEYRVLDASDDPALYKSGYLSPGKRAVVLKAGTVLKEGFYEARVTTETLKPISLLFARN